MKSKWLLGPVVVGVVLAVMLQTGGVALAHSGDWRMVYQCSWFCFYVPTWVPHDHAAETKREREKRCYEEYVMHRELCQLIYPGDSLGARRSRAHCYSEATQNLANCMRGR